MGVQLPLALLVSTGCSPRLYSIPRASKPPHLLTPVGSRASFHFLQAGIYSARGPCLGLPRDREGRGPPKKRAWLYRLKPGSF